LSKFSTRGNIQINHKMSIVTFEKPVPKVAESDWNYKVYELKESCDNHRLDAFKLRNESHRLRNDTDVTTYWSTHHTNSEIIDRYVFFFIFEQ